MFFSAASAVLVTAATPALLTLGALVTLRPMLLGTATAMVFMPMGTLSAFTL